jgi:hypothetical protein
VVRLARPTSRKGRAESARRHAADLGPVIKAVQAAGATSLRGIAKALNERGVPTATGKGKWEARSDVCWKGSQLGRPLSRPPSSMRPIGGHDRGRFGQRVLAHMRST